MDNDTPDSSGTAPSEETLSKEVKKAVRREREKLDLLSSLASGDFSAMRTRVAAMLNLYPHTRNSDVSLTLKYWETFQPDVFNASGIMPKDLFKLERLHYVVRARAKIQNEYGLFQADSAVRRRRKDIEEDMEEAVIEDAAPRRIAWIYSDETGKNQDYVIVAAVWVLTGRAVFDISRAIEKWQSSSSWSAREVHFAKFGKHDLDTLSEYLDVILANRQFLSLKFVAVERSKTKRSIDEVVCRLHEHMLTRGAEHEIKSGRIDLPREIDLTVDEEQSLDSFALADLKRRINERYKEDFDSKLTLSEIKSISSRSSRLVQLADLLAGSINRRLNHREARNFKDEMADMVISKLGLTLGEGDLPGLDATAIFWV